MDIGHMNFFNVESCGLYRVGSKKTYGCELEETFNLIKNWVKARPLAATLPWDEERNKPKFYCKDMYKDESSKDFFIVLWKSDTDNAGTLWGASEDSGSVVKYTNNYKGKKVIWGRPSYYWVVPEFNIVVSIKFDHSVSDSQLFEEYIKGCINNRVKHENRKKEHTNNGYVRLSYENEGVNYRYRFSKKLKSINTSNSELISLSKRVTHIIRRETIVVHSKDERSEWGKIFNNIIPLVSAKPKAKKRKIEVKAEAKPTPQEIKKIIEKNAIEGRTPNEWNNVGFTTDTGITWVDKYRLKDQIMVDIRNDKILSSKDLCYVINKKRNELLKPIKYSEKKYLEVS